MAIATVVCLAWLVTVAAGLGAEERTLAKWEVVMQKLDGKMDVSDSLAGLTKELESLTASKILCRFWPGTRVGIDLEDVTVGDCMRVAASKMVGMRQLETKIVSQGPDTKSNGKSMLTVWTNVAEGTTSSGAAVPGTRISYLDMVRFDFDDNGLINGMTELGDDGIVANIQDKVTAYTASSTLDLERELPAKRNTATAMKYVEAFQKLSGNVINPETWWAGILKDIASLTSPTMSCRFAPGTKRGFDLKDVSVSECLKTLGSGFGVSVKVVNQEMTSLAIDPSSDGRTILTQFQNVVERVTSSGAAVPGTRLSYPDVMRLDFNKEGLVVAMTLIGDDGVAASMEEEAQALAARARPGSLESTPVVAAGLVALGAAIGAWTVGREGRTVSQIPLLG